jgi:hypothetical protein
VEDCIAAVEAATARRDRFEAHIEAALADWSLAPVVRALQALRGMALVVAATLIAEVGDITRFANPRQLISDLGLVPSEHSSGGTRRQGGITKAGNSAARRMLIEAAWRLSISSPDQPRDAGAPRGATEGNSRYGMEGSGTAVSSLLQAHPSWEAADRGDRRDRARTVGIRLVNCPIGTLGERLTRSPRQTQGGRRPH